MHDAQYADAARPARVSILGLPMRDYSIGHEILLWRKRNTLATYSEESFAELDDSQQKDDLFHALFTCERSWTENFQPVRFACLFGWTRRNADYPAAFKAFREYRESGSQTLKTKKMPRVAGAPHHYFGAPETARLVLFVNRERLHESLGFETPYDFPFGLARILYLTQVESDGGIWVENAFDYEAKVRLEKFEKEHPDIKPAIGEEECQAMAEQWNKDHPETPVPLMRPKKGTDA